MPTAFVRATAGEATVMRDGCATASESAAARHTRKSRAPRETATRQSCAAEASQARSPAVREASDDATVVDAAERRRRTGSTDTGFAGSMEHRCPPREFGMYARH